MAAKFRILLFLLLTGLFSRAQTPISVPRSPASVLPTDQNLRAGHVLIIPVTHDTTVALSYGIDSLGMVIQVRSTGTWYKRDTNMVGGGHFWNAIAGGGGSGNTNSNTGTGFRWAIVGTNTVKTLGVTNGIKADSLTSGVITIQVDSSLYATLFYLQKVRDSLGSNKLSSVATANSVQGNGTGGSPVQLAGDAGSPGVSQYYGTNGSGAKGYYSLPAGVAPANPTASVGLSPVNGTASTFQRSDASPGLAAQPAGTVIANTTAGSAVPTYATYAQLQSAGKFVANQLNVQYLGFDFYANHPTGAGTLGIWVARDSIPTGAIFWDSAGVMTNLTPYFTFLVRSSGSSGDSVVSAINVTSTGMTLISPRMRDSAGSCIHHIVNADGSWTWYSTCSAGSLTITPIGPIQSFPGSSVDTLAIAQEVGFMFNKHNGTFVSGDIGLNTTSASVSGGILSLGAGSGTVTDTAKYITLSLTPIGNNPTYNSRWTFEMDFLAPTKTSTSFGPKMGIRSASSLYISTIDAYIDLSTGANAGKLFFEGRNQSPISTSGVLTWTAGDSLRQVLDLNDDTLTIRVTDMMVARNTTVTMKYVFNIVNSAVYMPNCGNAAIFSIGDAISNIYTAKFISHDLKYANMMVVGDSKGSYYQNTFLQRWPDQIGRYYGTYANYGQVGTGSADYVAEEADILFKHPRQVLFYVGCNDVSILSTFQTNSVAFYNWLKSVGIKPIVMSVQYETARNLDAMYAWERNASRPWVSDGNWIDLYSIPQTSGMLYTDGTHLTQRAADSNYISLLQSGLILGGHNSIRDNPAFVKGALNDYIPRVISQPSVMGPSGMWDHGDSIHVQTEPMVINRIVVGKSGVTGGFPAIYFEDQTDAKRYFAQLSTSNGILSDYSVIGNRFMLKRDTGNHVAIDVPGYPGGMSTLCVGCALQGSTPLQVKITGVSTNTAIESDGQLLIKNPSTGNFAALYIARQDNNSASFALYQPDGTSARMQTGGADRFFISGTSASFGNHVPTSNLDILGDGLFSDTVTVNTRTGSTADSVVTWHRLGANKGVFQRIAPITAGTNYQTVQAAGSAMTQRPVLNFTGASAQVTDNSGNTSTDIHLPGVIFSQTANGTAYANSTTVTNILGGTGVGTSVTAANTLVAGEIIHMRGSFQISTLASPGTLTWTSYDGTGGVGGPTTPPGPLTTQQGMVDIYVTITSTGSSGGAAVEIDVNYPTTDKIVITGTYTINTTISHTWGVNAQWQTASASNSIQTYAPFLVEIK